MITLDGWSIDNNPKQPSSLFFYQNNIRVVRAVYGKEVRCFVEVLGEDGEVNECLANHYTDIKEAIQYANTLLNIGV